MLGGAWMGYLAGCLPSATGRREVLLLSAYAVVACLCYGALLNLWFWPFLASGTRFGFVPGAGPLANLHNFVLFDATTSLGFDIPRAITNAALVLVLGAPVLAALRRVSKRAAFEPLVTLAPET
jgi:energy-coupling factor transport system substrate-specific component